MQGDFATQLHPSGLPSACQMAHTAVPAGLRSSMRTSGERCATTTGTWRTPAWCADSWAAARHCQPPWPRISGQGRVPSGWTTSTAWGRRSPCPTAGRRAGGTTTATTVKMLVWCAQTHPALLWTPQLVLQSSVWWAAQTTALEE